MHRFINFYQNNPKKLRSFIVTAAILAVLGYGALQLSASSSVCGGCHEIYRTSESWGRSIHAGVACVGCHRPPSAVGRITRIYLQLTEFNSNRANNRVKARVHDTGLVNKACNGCHSSNRAMAFSGGLNVPHERHIEKGFSCTICHINVVHGKGGEKTRRPEMETCMTCHNGERAPEGCGVCHLTLSGPISDYDPRNDGKH